MSYIKSFSEIHTQTHTVYIILSLIGLVVPPASYHGKRKKTVSDRQLCLRVWMNHLCHIFKAEATFFFLKELAAYFIWCARLLTHIFNIKEKKRGGLCCQVKVVEIVVLEMSIGRGLLLLFWDSFLLTVKHVQFTRQSSSEILSLEMRIIRERII